MERKGDWGRVRDGILVPRAKSAQRQIGSKRFRILKIFLIYEKFGK